MKFEIRKPNPALNFRSTPQRRQRTTRIILHHYHHERATPQEVHRWHLNNGWLGFGYNVAVDMDGTIWEGRGLDNVGTHTGNNNGDSIGIALQGRYDDHTTQMPDAQFNALVWLIQHIRGIYGELPILRHRDVTATACPGRHFPWEELQRMEFRGDIAIEATPARTVTLDILGRVEEIAGYIENGATWVRLTEFVKALGFVASWDSNRRIPTIAAIKPTEYPACTLDDIDEKTQVEAAEDIRLLKVLTHWEARGEDTKGQIMVVNVVMNRVKSSRFPNTIREVIFAPNAFTPTQRADFENAIPNARTIAAVNEALSGVDHSKGAEFFHAISHLTPQVFHERAVAKGTLVITHEHGNHRFYKHAS